MPRARLAIDISSDLVFADPELEFEYRKHHTNAQVSGYTDDIPRVLLFAFILLMGVGVQSF